MGGISNAIGHAMNLEYIPPAVSVVVILIMIILVGKVFSKTFVFEAKTFVGGVLGGFVAALFLIGVNNVIMKSEGHFGLSDNSPQPYADNVSDYMDNDCFFEKVITHLSQSSNDGLTSGAEGMLVEALTFAGNKESTTFKNLMAQIADFVRNNHSISDETLEEFARICFIN